MVNHFTPLGNSVTRNTIMNNANLLSKDVDVRVNPQHVYHSKPKEAPLKHLKRICNEKNRPSNNQMVELKARVCLYLAIVEQLKRRKSTKLITR